MDEQNTVTQVESESNALEQQAANPQTVNEQAAATTSQDEAQPVAEVKPAENNEAVDKQAANPQTQTANEQAAATTSQDEAQPVADSKTTENETATVQVPEPSQPEANKQNNSESISLIAAIICGAIVAFIYLRWKKLHNLRVVTFEEVCQFARELKKQHPKAEFTMVSVVVNEKTNTTTLIQVALDKDRLTIEQGQGNVVGRQLRILDVDSKLKELMGDDIKCIIPIE